MTNPILYNKLSLRLAAIVPALVGIELVGISDLLWIEMCKVM